MEIHQMSLRMPVEDFSRIKSTAERIGLDPTSLVRMMLKENLAAYERRAEKVDSGTVEVVDSAGCNVVYHQEEKLVGEQNDKSEQETEQGGLSEIQKRRIEQATVHLPDLGGQGVLIPGGLILTAARCVEWTATGLMALEDYSLARIEIAGGKRFRGSVYAVEPVADIAVVGEPDGQVFPEDWDQWNSFCESVEPVPLCLQSFPLCIPQRVYLWTHTGEWGQGVATRHGLRDTPPGARVWLRTPSTLIEGGTSGSPVVDGNGLLVGVVSNTHSCDGDVEHGGFLPVAHLCLPRWILDTVVAAQKEKQP